MVRALDLSDFRAIRKVLEPHDFALGSDEPDPPPRDLIDQDVWDGFMTLPTDVAIRTTSHQGDRVGLLYELWAAWIESLPEQGIVSEGMLEATDDFDAVLFNLVHGFYKQSLFCLRSALETMTYACSCHLRSRPDEWKSWQHGAEVRFADTIKQIGSATAVSVHDARARAAAGASMFPDPSDLAKPNIWTRDLYRRLSGYAHARGDTTNSSIWKSTGPIYSAEGMRISYQTYLETYALLMLLIELCQPSFRIPDAAQILFKAESIARYLTDPFGAVCAAYVDQAGK
jgi:hypothetical protein